MFRPKEAFAGLDPYFPTRPPDLMTRGSPDLNLTPLAAFFTFFTLNKKRKKAARGVRFKSGLDQGAHLAYYYLGVSFLWGHFFWR